MKTMTTPRPGLVGAEPKDLAAMRQGSLFGDYLLEF